jgi:hypothetical protein
MAGGVVATTTTSGKRNNKTLVAKMIKIAFVSRSIGSKN